MLDRVSSSGLEIQAIIEQWKPDLYRGSYYHTEMMWSKCAAFGVLIRLLLIFPYGTGTSACPERFIEHSGRKPSFNASHFGHICSIMIYLSSSVKKRFILGRETHFPSRYDSGLKGCSRDDLSPNFQTRGFGILFGIIYGGARRGPKAYNWYLTSDMCSLVFFDTQPGKEYTAAALNGFGFEPTFAML